MAVQLNLAHNTETLRAASAINAYAAVQLGGASAFMCVPASGASAGVAPAYGFAVATAASPGMNVEVQTGGWAKAWAGASIGIGGVLGCGIGTYALVPVTPSGVASAIAVTGVQFPRTVIAIALENAAAGSIFTVKVLPPTEAI